MSEPFNPAAATVNVAVTATSASVALPAAADYADTLRLVNVGTQTIFVEVSSGAAAATATSASSLPMLPNTELVIEAPRSKFVSAVAAATGSTLYATAGIGGI